MKKINLEITVDEANLVLDALSQMPFVKVFALISKIQDQASQQLGEEQNQIANGLKPEKNDPN